MESRDGELDPDKPTNVNFALELDGEILQPSSSDGFRMTTAAPVALEGAQVVENVEIERGLRTKDYRPRGQGRLREKAQAVVVIAAKLCN